VIPLDAILDATCRRYGIPMRALTGRGRTPRVAAARRTAMLFAAEAGWSIKAIADAFECDRGTVTVQLRLERAERAGVKLTVAEARRAIEFHSVGALRTAPAVAFVTSEPGRTDAVGNPGT